VSLELSLHVVGVTHHTAAVGTREHLVLTPAEAAAWLEHRRLAGRSAVILSTCNRFEIYWTGAADVESWFRDFADTRGVELGEALIRLDGVAAARHLFSVAAGLDSQILGETEILGQVRRAQQSAHAAGTTDREIDVVVGAAIACGRRVRHETALGRHPASVSSAAVDVALEVGGAGRAVVLGAGEVAEGVVGTLSERGVTDVLLVNRGSDRAGKLAEKWKLAAAPWDQLGRLLSEARFFFVTTGAKHPLVDAALLARATTGRADDLIVMDLAVPRNVEPAARELAALRLYDLDDLQRLRCPVAGEASIAVAEAERIVAEELVRLEVQLKAREAAPRLAELHRLGAELAREESERALSRLERLSDVERQVVRDMAERLVRRVLYPVSRSLRSADEPDGPAPGDGKRTA
jgi:glutamyl-tRNA reductase